MSAKLSTFCCSVTPFDAAGRIDQEAAEAHFTRMADAGVNLYIGGSSPGEGYSQSDDEILLLLRLAVKSASGKVSVRAMGVEPRHAEEMVSFLKRASDTGVDACQIYSLDVGHGWKPGPVELETYFRKTLEASALPSIISSHAFMGYNVPIELIERLADDYPHLIGVNLTTLDMFHLTGALERLRPRLEVHVGGPMNAPIALALGGSGFLSSEASLCPKLARSVITHWEAGRFQNAFDAYGSIMALMVALSAIPGASTRRSKAALRVLGHQGTHLRDPYEPLAEGELDAVRRVLESIAERPGCEELVPRA